MRYLMLIFKILLVDFKLKSMWRRIFWGDYVFQSVSREYDPVSCNLLENHKKTILLEDKSNS